MRVRLAARGAFREYREMRSSMFSLVAVSFGCGGTHAAPPDASVCGPAPYVTIGGTLHSYVDSSVVIAGATLSADICSGMWTTDAAGTGSFLVAKDVAFTGRLEHPDYIPMQTTVEQLEADFDASGFMIPKNLASLLPHWSTSTPTALLTISIPASELPSDAPSTCKTKDGLSITVLGHPEAVVTYFSGTSFPTPDPTLTSTGPLGIAEISGLPATAPGESLPLAITSGCPLATLTSYPHLPRMTLQNGFLTVILVRIPALPWPSGAVPM